MSPIGRCTVCGSKADAFLCNRCTAVLRVALTELRVLLGELVTTVARQDRLNDAPRALYDRVTVDVADLQHAAIPARLRSLQGRIALPSTPWPYAFDAATLLDETRTVLVGWIRHLTETRGITLELATIRPAGPACQTEAVRVGQATVHQDCPHPSCADIRAERSQDYLVTQWLLSEDVINAIRMDEAAGALLQELEGYADAINAAIDHRLPEVFCGRCETPDVFIETEATIGPVCCWTWAGDGHASCRAIADRVLTLIPRATVCGTDLYALLSEEKITCPKCGTEYVVSEQKAAMLARSEDQLGTAVEIASALTGLLDQGVDEGGKRLAVEVNSDMIRGMAKRKQIPERGTGLDGRTQRYRLGDVLAVLRARQERRKVAS